MEQIAEIAGTLIGIAYLYWEYRADNKVWIAGILMPAISLVVYWRTALYADFGINVYYLLVAVYGLWMWRRRASGSTKSFPEKTSELPTIDCQRCNRLSEVPRTYCQRCNGLSEVPRTHCQRCNRLSEVPRVHCQRCNGPSEVPRTHCQRCNGLSEVPRMRCQSDKLLSRTPESSERLPITHTPARMWPVLALAFLALQLGLGLSLMQTDSNVPWWDAFTTALSVVGMWMLARKWVEQWMVWMVVDVFSCGLYIYKGIYFYAALYGVYAVVAWFGYRKWRGMMLHKN